MINIKSLDCCGIKEIIDIDDYRTEPEQIVEDLCEDYYEFEHKCAFYIFSDIQDKIAGKNLMKYILKNNLGTVTLSPVRVNPNSDNSLRVYIWTISRVGFRKYWNKYRNKNDEEY